MKLKFEKKTVEQCTLHLKENINRKKTSIKDSETTTTTKKKTTKQKSEVWSQSFNCCKGVQFNRL